MELRHLRYFVAVAEQESFSRAAQALHVSQSAISEQIADLEREVGIQLLDRGARKTLLTQSGMVFLQHARRVLEEANNALVQTQRAERGEVGTLRIGFFAGSVGEGFPMLVRSFRQSHPHVELSLMEMTPVEQWAALEDGRIDLGFTRIPEPQFRREIRHETLRLDPIVAILPRDHPRADVKRLDLKDLANDPFIISARDVSPAVYDKVTELCAEAGFVPNIASTSSVWSSVILMVQSGEGVALLPLNHQQSLTKDLVFVPLKSKDATVALCICWSARRDRQLLRSFRDLTRAHMRSNTRL